MYESYYQLKGKPFSKTPDPAYLFLSNQHQEALARLQLAVTEREVAVLVGRIGCGKTTLSRALVDALDKKCVPIVLINPNLSPAQLLGQIAVGLGVEQPPRSKRLLVDQIQTRLFDEYKEERCPVFIIDEAQLIPSKECFDELRLLTNFQLDDQNLFSLILVGQPELMTRLAKPAYEAFRQRIGLISRLGVLSEEETRQYVRFRLKKAGGHANLFTAAALEKIHEFSGGVPRVINHLCTNALLEGMGRDAKTLGPEIIADVHRDMSFQLS